MLATTLTHPLQTSTQERRMTVEERRVTMEERRATLHNLMEQPGVPINSTSQLFSNTVETN